MQASRSHNCVSWQHQWNAYQRRAFAQDLGQLEWRVDQLRRSTRAAGLKIAAKLNACCREPIIVAIENGQDYYISESRCRSRVCPRCSKIRSRQLSSRIQDLLHTMDDPRFLTLSMRSNHQPLADQIKQLRRTFAKMRRTAQWADHVRGGVYTIEVTWNDDSEQWHPHIHAIIDGIYWPWAEILAIWEAKVRDEASVHIEVVRGIRRLANYLASYVSKSCDLTKLDGPQLAEWAVETHGLRLAQTFGCLQHCKPAAEEIQPLPTRAIDLDVNSLANAASCGVQDAEDLLNALDPRTRKDDDRSRHERAAFLYIWQHLPTERPPPKRPPLDNQLRLN